MSAQVDVLGCSIDRAGMRDTLARIEALIAAGGYGQHMAINTAKLVTLRDDARMERSSSAATS